MELQGKRGAGAFQWNQGGWFGSQIGATAWLLILGVMLLAQWHVVGAWVLGMGLVANLVGLLLWRARYAIAPFLAIQTLMAVCGSCAALSLLAIVRSGLELAAVGFPTPWFLLIYPVLMVAFFAQEWSSRKVVASQQDHFG